MEPKLLVFDLDGTLVESRRDLWNGINRMRAMYELPSLDFETVCRNIGEGVTHMVQRSLPETFPETDIPEAVARYRAIYDDHLVDETVPYPGVTEVLPRLHALGHQLAVLSNKPGQPCRRILEHFGLDHWFFRILGGDDVPRMKPDPCGLQLLMEERGIIPEQTWMIGDHVTDLEAAHRAGVQSVFIRFGIGRRGSYPSDLEVETFKDLGRFFSESD